MIVKYSEQQEYSGKERQTIVLNGKRCELRVLNHSRNTLNLIRIIPEINKNNFKLAEIKLTMFVKLTV